MLKVYNDHAVVYRIVALEAETSSTATGQDIGDGAIVYAKIDLAFGGSDKTHQLSLMLRDIACKAVGVDVVIADEIEGIEKVGGVEFLIDSVGRLTHNRSQDPD